MSFIDKIFSTFFRLDVKDVNNAYIGNKKFYLLKFLHSSTSSSEESFSLASLEDDDSSYCCKIKFIQSFTNYPICLYLDRQLIKE